MNRTLLALLLIAQPVHAAGLYEASSPTTGTDARDRGKAIADAFRQVVVKATGNPALADDPRLGPLLTPGMVAALAYIDRMPDTPKHDDQGSRDRPYDLLVRFDRSGIGAALAALQQPVWRLEDRPSLALQITIAPRKGEPIPLQADTIADEPHRAAVVAAADRLALSIVLPLSNEPTPPADAVLHGTITWQDAAAGWVGTWGLAWHGRDYGWQVTGVGFDEAYRNALSGAAAILSRDAR